MLLNNMKTTTHRKKMNSNNFVFKDLSEGMQSIRSRTHNDGEMAEIINYCLCIFFFNRAPPGGHS